MGLCSLGRMVFRVLFVCTSRVGVMRSLLMAARLVVLCRFLMVPRRVLVMFRCFAVMLCCFLRHDFLHYTD